jgi:hypothetical protein
VTGAADGTVGVWGLRGELHGMMQQHYAPVRLLAQGDETLVSGEFGALCAVAAIASIHLKYVCAACHRICIGESSVANSLAQYYTATPCTHAAQPQSDRHAWNACRTLAYMYYDYHVSNGVLQWVETALRACPALYAGVG